MSDPTCACGQPLRDNATLCHRCTSRFEKNLAEIPALAGEVQTSRLRQSRIGRGNVGVTSRSAEHPLPFDDRPAKRAKELLLVLRTWCGVVVERQGKGWPRDTIEDSAVFLLGSLRWLRHQNDAPDAAEQIGRAVRRLRSTVDRPADVMYAGICSALTPVEIDDTVTVVQCSEHLYVPFGREKITCPQCGAQHDTARRQEVLLAALEDQLSHIALLTRGLSRLGQEVNESTIRSWVLRNRLFPRGQDDLGRQLYRIGDVLDLLNETAQAQADRDAKKGRQVG